MPAQPEDLDRLNVIHVAGTKGKGSVCAFVASILTQHQRARGLPRKIGLLTSPHLIAVRERIRLDGQPLSEDLFARYFFEVYDALSADGPGTPEAPSAPGSPAPGSKPIYARYLTLLAFHVFLREGVDAAVVETGVGGEYDATNMVARPLAAGISTLGIDHVLVLGATADEIAWHKAGVLKPGRPAFAVEQVAFPSTEAVLRARAAERGVAGELRFVGADDPRLRGVRVRPDAAFQRRNASLAVALAEAALEVLDPEGLRESRDGEGETARLPVAFREGLEQVVWRGRCEVKEETETDAETGAERVRVRWHVDGAHTTDSLKVAARWFAGECEGRRGPRVLVFNQQGRTEAVDFLEGLHTGSRREDGSSFDHVVFCTNVTYAASGYKRGELVFTMLGGLALICTYAYIRVHGKADAVTNRAIVFGQISSTTSTIPRLSRSSRCSASLPSVGQSWTPRHTLRSCPASRRRSTRHVRSRTRWRRGRRCRFS